MKFGSRKEYENDIIKNQYNDLWKSNCPFCKKDEFVIWEWDYWFISHNKYPYLGLENHLLAIPHRHVVYTKDLSKEECEELPKVFEFMNKFYEWGKYFSFIRETIEWRSLEHLHYHYLPGFITWSDIEYFLDKNLNKQWNN